MSNITSVPSHVAGDEFTQAMWENLQGNINDGIVNQVCATRVYKTSGFSTGSSLQPIPFDSERYDGDSIHDPADNTKLTAQTAGIYRIGGNVEWPADSGTGRLILAVRLNGTTYVGKDMKHGDGATNTAHSLAGIDFYLGVGDYVELCASSQNGLTIAGDADLSPEFWMSRV